jgi:hypothetical protein
MEKHWAACSSCVRETIHEVLLNISRQDPGEEAVNNYMVLSCGGCGDISMRYLFRPSNEADAFVQYYPPPVSRKEPEWASFLDFKFSEDHLVSLLKEIYQSIHGGQHRLAAMGIRALLEQVMIAKIDDIGGFDKKLDAFQKAGFISLIQRDAMRATLDVGDGAMHRAFKPDGKDLNAALDIVEGVMPAIYFHREAAEKLTDRVPPRKAPPRPPDDEG